jgi:PST family polysaccharide transporter
VATLLARRVIVQVLSIVATSILMRLLSVEQFGLYAIASFVVIIGGYFADAGLGAALIQRKEEVSQDDINVVFTVQSVLLVVITIAIFLVAPWLQQQYALPAYSVWLIRVLGLTLFLSSLRLVPIVMLERRLEYQKLSIADVSGLLAFQVTAVLLALAGMGAWSFVLAALFQAAVVAIVLYILCPWRPRYTLQWRRARALLRFGGLVQARTFMVVIKDNITPALIAAVGGPVAVGYVGFAQKLSSYPLVIEEATSRVSFPTYSRIQDDLPRLQRAIEKSLKLVNLLLFPFIMLLIVLAEPLVRLVLGTQWLPALPAFYLFALANLTAGMSNVLVSSLFALGRPGVVIRLSTFWAVATWTLALPLVIFYGWIGLPIATFLLAGTVALPVWEIRKIIPVRVLDAVLKPGIVSMLAAGAAAASRLVLDGTIAGLLGSALTGSMVYIVGIVLVDGRWLATELMTALPPKMYHRLAKAPFIGAFATAASNYVPVDPGPQPR